MSIRFFQISESLNSNELLPYTSIQINPPWEISYPFILTTTKYFNVQTFKCVYTAYDLWI